MRFLKILIDLNIWVAAGATALFHYTLNLFQLPSNLWLILFVFFSTLFTYQGQNYLKERLRQKSGNQKIKRFQLLSLLFSSSSIIVIVLFFPVIDKTVIILFSSFLLSLFYAFPFKSSSNKPKMNLRSRPFLKIYLIALVWTAVCAFFPLYRNGSIDTSNWLWIISVFILILAITIPFDIRDLKFDKENMRTIPQIMGVKRAKHLALFLIALSFSAFFLASQLTYISNLNFILFSILCGLNALFIWKCHPEKDPYYFGSLIDGSLLILFLSV
ncbi:MAG: UbiA family prenyltransferase [Bacteroidota bacterium]